jgi:RNA polymerase sigma-70 factor, ECF subfamily
MGLERDTVVQVLLRERIRVMAIASAIVRDVHAADDIYQQVVLSALQATDKFADREHVVAWALRAARHRALDLTARRQIASLPDDVLDLLEADWSDAPGQMSDQAEALHRCMQGLAQPTRELLRLRYSEGLTAVAIAGKMRRTADAVYQNLSRVHRLLRDCVERQMTRTGQPAERGAL